ncbi:phospholipase A2 group XV-like [Branchiostoma floridae]|uniref:Phospholipase A2 group XV-like n=1 Tax=Branchiostoma floridae TaxID=7739 RepID=A0A9J7LA50_BRAFL|nr:phospholipase A2 group XV-like [Branchiostoma floridae]
MTGFRRRLLLFFLLVAPPTLLYAKPTGWEGGGNKYVRKQQPVPHRSPVVLIPGDGGSQLEAKLNKPSSPHYFCDKTTEDYFDLWLNIELLLPYVLDCWVDNMKLLYHKENNTVSNNVGVDIRVPGFGDTETVEWLDVSHASISSYFTNIAEALVKAGYTRGVALRGAPYDFRMSHVSLYCVNPWFGCFFVCFSPFSKPLWFNPHRLNLGLLFIGLLFNLLILFSPDRRDVDFPMFKQLIEETYYKNNNSRVVLVTHSMGGPYGLLFLNNMDQPWKDKFIKSMVTLAGPWGGAAKTLRLYISGDNLGIYVVNPLSLRPEQRSFPSSAWMMPSPLLWDTNEPLVFTPDRNYTIGDYAALFDDLEYEQGWLMRKDVEGLIGDLTPPGVTVHCLHGNKVKTPHQFSYTAKEFPDLQPTVIYGDGDGTVNLNSARGCLRWRDQQKQPVFYKTFEGAEHMKILANQTVIEYIKDVVFSPDVSDL